MTPRDLQTLIHSTADCADHIHINEMPAISGYEVRAKDQAVADVINGLGVAVQITSRPIGLGTVLDALGPTEGAAVLDTLYAMATTVRPVYYALKLLEQGGLDVGMTSTRAQIDALVGSAFTAEQAAVIKTLAESPEIITAAQVSVALRGPWE